MQASPSSTRCRRDKAVSCDCWSLLLSFVLLLSVFLLASWSTASAQGKLAWDDPNPSQNVGGYYLYYWRVGQSVPTKVDIASSNPYSLSNLSLLAGQTYNFAVAVYDTNGNNESARSNVVSKAISSNQVPVNQAPVARDLSLTTPEDKAIQRMLQATDTDNNTLTYRLITSGSRGTAVLNNPSTGAFTYTPRANVTGTDTFTFRANDGAADSNVATVTITISAVNDPPVARPDTATTKKNTAVTIAVLANDTDVDGDTLALISVTPGAKGRAVLVGTTNVRYTPVANVTGQDTFTYTVRDGHGGTASGTVTLGITSVNNAPVAQNGTLSAPVGTTTSGSLRASDTDGNTLTYRLVRNGGKGIAKLVNAATGAYTYTPTATATGTDTFTFRVNDGQADSNIATVTVTLVASQHIFEVGAIEVDHRWQRVTFQQPFTAPVVVAKSASYYGSDPATIRVRNVNAHGFEVRMQEWDYLDGTHVLESVSYLVMEAGHHTLGGNVQVEAGTRTLNNPAQFTALSFNQTFGIPPIVLTAVSSINDSTAVTTRVHDISRTRFRVRLQEQEANPTSHGPETLAYIAWEPSEGTLADGMVFEVGTTSRVMDHTFRTIAFVDTFPILPLFLADLQTTYGTDTAALRWENLYVGGVDVKVEEEQSKDAETTHISEVVGYMVFANP